MLLALIGMSAWLAIGLTILVIAVALIVIFYLMYHTYHGNLPGMMKLIVIGFLCAAGIFILVHFLT